MVDSFDISVPYLTSNIVFLVLDFQIRHSMILLLSFIKP